jgi:thioester reductase-like protein
MVPGRFVFLDSLPRGTSGKVDRRALHELGTTASLGQAAPEPPARAPRSSAERELSAIWARVLGHVEIDPDQELSALGGDSIAALELSAAMHRAGWRIAPAALLRGTTIAALAAEAAGAVGGSEARSAPQLAADAKLDDDLVARLRTRGKAGQRGRAGAPIVLTGATGALGRRLALELLERRASSPLVCLIRARSAEEAEGRLHAALLAAGATPEALRSVSALPADLAAPGLGLSRSSWDRLAEEAGLVVHAGARVNLALSYDDLRADNLGGTREVLRLAVSGRTKVLHAISTLSVFVAAEPLPASPSEDDELDGTVAVHGGYAQTKWAAERLLIEARRAGFDALFIYRLGLLTGTRADFLSVFLRGLIGLGVVPPGPHAELRLDLTPIDEAARAIGEILDRGEAGSYHLASPRAVSLAELLEAVRSFGIAIEEVPLEEWRAAGAEARGDQAATYLALGRCLDPESFEAYRTIDLFQASGVRFDLTRSTRVLGRTLPPAGRAAIARHLAQLLERGDPIGARRRTSRQPPSDTGRAALYDAFLGRRWETGQILSAIGRLTGGATGDALDLGCGTGRLLAGLAALGWRVTGMEPDRDYLARARARARAAMNEPTEGEPGRTPLVLVEGGLLDLEASEAFDLVLSINGPLSYLRSAAARREALVRIAHALRPGGRLILDVPNFPYLEQHYLPPPAESIPFEDGAIRRLSRHRISTESWIHEDTIELEPGGTLRKETFVFAILNVNELRTLIEEVGLVEVVDFPSFDAALQGPPPLSAGPRLLFSARKPG